MTEDRHGNKTKTKTFPADLVSEGKIGEGGQVLCPSDCHEEEPSRALVQGFGSWRIEGALGVHSARAHVLKGQGAFLLHWRHINVLVCARTRDNKALPFGTCRFLSIAYAVWCQYRWLKCSLFYQSTLVLDQFLARETSGSKATITAGETLPSVCEVVMLIYLPINMWPDVTKR